MLVKINNNDVMVKEFQGQRVVTAWDIAKVHNREVKRINEIFKNNIDKFILKEDYFLLTPIEFFESFKTVQDFIPDINFFNTSQIF